MFKIITRKRYQAMEAKIQDLQLMNDNLRNDISAEKQKLIQCRTKYAEKVSQLIATKEKLEVSDKMSQELQRKIDTAIQERKRYEDSKTQAGTTTPEATTVTAGVVKPNAKKRIRNHE